jgi:hypothetical protein
MKYDCRFRSLKSETEVKTCCVETRASRKKKKNDGVEGARKPFQPEREINHASLRRGASKNSQQHNIATHEKLLFVKQGGEQILTGGASKYSQ